MRLSFWAIGFFFIALSSQPQPANAGKLRKLWEVDLSKVTEADVLSESPVFALRFSPDGRKLAVIAGMYGTGIEATNRLLVGSIDHAPEDVREFEIPFADWEGNDSTWNFGWAPSGEIIYAAGTVIHLASGITCQLPEQAVFLRDDTAVSVRWAKPFSSSTTHVTFYDQNCRVSGNWDVPEIWKMKDASPERGLISVTNFMSSGESQTLVVDPLARRVLQRWRGGMAQIWRFADGGKVVCLGGAVKETTYSAAVCANVDTGKLLRKTRTNGIEPIATSARATRLVLSDYQRREVSFESGYRTVFEGRHIWDFATGQDLAKWCPGSENHPDVFVPRKRTSVPFRFALSPDGQYIAEGGNGKLRLYQIEP